MCRSIEIPYGDKDQKGDYTLQVNDLVDFNIATDRRDKLQRATNIQLVGETFLINGEMREQGLICSVKDGFGFIRCMERETRMFFHFSEMMTPERHVQINDEVQFTVIQARLAALCAWFAFIVMCDYTCCRTQLRLLDKSPSESAICLAERSVSKRCCPSVTWAQSRSCLFRPQREVRRRSPTRTPIRASSCTTSTEPSRRSPSELPPSLESRPKTRKRFSINSITAVLSCF